VSPSRRSGGKVGKASGKSKGKSAGNAGKAPGKSAGKSRGASAGSAGKAGKAPGKSAGKSRGASAGSAGKAGKASGKSAGKSRGASAGSAGKAEKTSGRSVGKSRSASEGSPGKAGKVPGRSADKPGRIASEPTGRGGRPSSGAVENPANGSLDAVVAVLEKRGRFWAAEPVFPAPRSEGTGRHGGVSRRIALGSNRIADRDGDAARTGDLVLVRQVGRGKGARAQIVRVLGRPDVAGDLIEGLMLDRGLARGFEQAVEREARAASEKRIHATDGRRDLTSLPTFTIDPASARDFDDAISAEYTGSDPTSTDRRGRGIRVWVHIADVSAYVTEGSLVDLEAKRRGTSVYVPGAVEPMLPEALSNDACSLVPGVERAAVTVELELQGAKVVRAAFYRSLIRSDERLSYEQVDRIFAGSERASAPWAEPLRAAREVAGALEEERRKGHSGALTLDSSEPEFSFDGEGNVSEICMRAQTESHRLIEHLMIAANEAVARLLSERGTPCLYRVHERPEPERVKRLIDQLSSLEVPTPPVPKNMSPSQAAELMGEISRGVEAHVRGVVARAEAGDGRAGAGNARAGAGDGRALVGDARAGAGDDLSAGASGGRAALTSLILRTLQQAAYSPKNKGHAGLGTAHYCHFTSPIRRYPDLVCHRALLSAVGAGERPVRAAELADLAEWTSDRERAAMKVERDADDVARCFALERVLYEDGWEQTFVGEVVGLIAAGAFLAFGTPSAREGDPILPIYEGMLPVRHMRGEGGAREWWELNEQGTILHGESPASTLRLGDAVEVRVARVDVARGRVDLLPA
jgi:ribonuclease R